jgi:predicted metal-binding protein
MFNEQTLLNDVEEKWGEYGAHAEVVRWMMNRIHELTQAGQDLAEEIISTECSRCPNYTRCECGRQQALAVWTQLTGKSK